MTQAFIDQRLSRSRLLRLLLVLAVAGFFMGVAPAEVGAAKAKSIKTEAFFVSLDTENKTMEVRVKKTGSKPKNKKLRLKIGKEATFNVKPEGSILKRTSVSLDGQRSDINEIEPDQFLFIYWVPDEKNPDQRFARKIDLVLTEDQLDERNAARLEAAKAAGKLQDGE